MGKRGPKPMPTNVLRLRGSWLAGQRTGEPTPSRKPPVKPDWLAGEAAVAWDRVTTWLDGMGILTETDSHMLARYCAMWADWRACHADVEAHGHTYPKKDAEGKVRGLAELPQSAIALKLDAQLLRMENHLGLTPSARASIGMDRWKQDVANPAAEYLT